MPKGASRYASRMPDATGRIRYEAEEDAVWRDLYRRQEAALAGRACDAYLAALGRLDLPRERVAQPAEVSERLRQFTGWSVEPVPALISFERFFGLLARRRFPAATFIRRREDFDYLPEPDVFHEIFGHCPLLTDPVYADFMQRYGEMGLQATKADRVMLARLYWFTVEFGLIQAPDGPLRIYGAGVVSSVGESQRALESPEPERRPLDLVRVLRTRYRIDRYQRVYYVIDDLGALYRLLDENLFAAIAEARRLGPLPQPEAEAAA